jgi:hypothetical protein
MARKFSPKQLRFLHWFPERQRATLLLMLLLFELQETNGRDFANH